jgi:hypothetical protein
VQQQQQQQQQANDGTEHSMTALSCLTGISFCRLMAPTQL